MKYVLHVYRSHGQWRWRVTHRNGRKLCNGGESYRRIGTLITVVRRLFMAPAILRQVNAIEEAWRLSRAKGKRDA